MKLLLAIALMVVFCLLETAAPAVAAGHHHIRAPLLELRLQHPRSSQRSSVDPDLGERDIGDFFRSGCHGARCYDKKRFGQFMDIAHDAVELQCALWGSKEEAARRVADDAASVVGGWATRPALASWLMPSVPRPTSDNNSNGRGGPVAHFLDEVLSAAEGVGETKDRWRNARSCLPARLALGSAHVDGATVVVDGTSATAQAAVIGERVRRPKWWYDRHNISWHKRNGRTATTPASNRPTNEDALDDADVGYELLPVALPMRDKTQRTAVGSMDGRWTCRVPMPVTSELSMERIELVCRNGGGVRRGTDGGGAKRLPPLSVAAVVSPELTAPCRPGGNAGHTTDGSSEVASVTIRVPPSAVVCAIEYDVVRPAPISAQISLAVLFPTAVVFMAIMGYLILSPSYQRSVAAQRLTKKFDELQDWVSQRERTMHVKAELEGTLGVAGSRTVVNGNHTDTGQSWLPAALQGADNAAGDGAAAASGMRRRLERLDAMGLVPTTLNGSTRRTQNGASMQPMQAPNHPLGSGRSEHRAAGQPSLRGGGSERDAHRAVYNNPQRRTLGELLAQERGGFHSKDEGDDGAAPGGGRWRRTNLAVVPDVAEYYSDVFGTSGPASINFLHHGNDHDGSRRQRRQPPRGADQSHHRSSNVGVAQQQQHTSGVRGQPRIIGGVAAVSSLYDAGGGDTYPIDGAL